jgi:hypothetical protein
LISFCLTDLSVQDNRLPIRSMTTWGQSLRQTEASKIASFQVSEIEIEADGGGDDDDNDDVQPWVNLRLLSAGAAAELRDGTRAGGWNGVGQDVGRRRGRDGFSLLKKF